MQSAVSTFERYVFFTIDLDKVNSVTAVWDVVGHWQSLFTQSRLAFARIASYSRARFE
jgi:hypothetical protein